jgi:hypothetical protein
MAIYVRAGVNTDIHGLDADDQLGSKADLQRLAHLRLLSGVKQTKSTQKRTSVLSGEVRLVTKKGPHMAANTVK